MTGHFNKFETLDTYIDFYRDFRFKDKVEFNQYIFSIINDLAELKNKGIVRKDLYDSNIRNFTYLIINHGLSYAYILINYFSFCIDKGFIIKYKNDVTVNEILNKICNYNCLNDKNYSLLSPHLKFYKELSNLNNTDYLTEEEINSTLLEFKSDLTVNLIKDSLFNNGLVLPYKDNYMWSNKHLLKSIRVMDLTLINILCLNLLLSKLKD